MAKEAKETTVINETPEKVGTKTSVELATPIKRARTLEALHTANPKTMTQTEAIRVIKDLRAKLSASESKIKLLNDNCKSAYEKIRVLQETPSKCANVAQQSHNYALSCVENMLRALKQNKVLTDMQLNNIIKGENI